MPTVSPVVYAEDKRLVSRLLAGDEAAFKQFFAGHYQRLYRFALARTDHDVGAAEDAASFLGRGVDTKPLKNDARSTGPPMRNCSAS